MLGFLEKRPNSSRWGAVEMLGSGSGMERILSSFETGWLTGLNGIGTEDDCPFTGAEAHLATYWQDGFYTGRADALAAGDTLESPDNVFARSAAPDIGLAA
jgi:hypothetical protein